MASVSATDLNTTDEISSDSIDDEVISVEDSLDDLSVSDDSPVLKKNITPSAKTFTAIQNAINSASAGDNIILDGTYNQDVVSGWKVTINVNKNVSLIGINNARLLGTTAKHEPQMMNINADGVLLKNLTFQNGRIEWGNPAGAIWCSGHDFTIDGCKFISNYAFDDGNHHDHEYGASGGAIALTNSKCTIINSYFSGNHALIYGGMMFIKGNSEVKFINSSFVGNYITNDGGVVAVHDSSKCDFIDCYFEKNSATYGGAIYFGGSSKGNVVNCSFVKNSATNGGAINIGRASGNNANVTILNSSFISNTATYGGAVRCEGYTNCLINGSYFNENSAQYGGAFFTADTSVNSLLITDSLFEKNHAVRAGGSLYVQYVKSSSVDNCEFVNDYTDHVGGSVHYYKSQNCDLENCKFINCSSVNNGGSLTMDGCSQILVNNSEFVNSSSGKEGSAIYGTSASKDIYIGFCSFDNCTSANGKDSISFTSDVSNYNVFNSEFDKALETTKSYFVSTITSKDLSIVKGDSAIIEATLSYFKGPLSKREVVFTVNGNKIPKTTDSSGFVSFDATNYLSVSNNEINISYAGDEINNAVTKTVHVKVNLYMGSLIANQSGRYYGNKSVSIKYIDSKNKAREDIPVNIIVYSNGEIFKTDLKFTDSNNMVAYSMSTAAFVPGNYSVYAYVDVDNVDIKPIRLDDVIISKISGVIELSKSKSNKTLYVTLVNKTTGDVFSGIDVKLQFNRNGYEGSVTTGSDGSKSFSMSDFKPDTYSVTASVDSAGFKEFADADLENIVITSAGKEDSILEFGSNIVFDYLKSGYTTVTKIEGCTIGECVIEGHSDVGVAVNDNKITVYGYNLLGAGNYNLKVTTVPDVDHNAVTKTVKVTVNKIDSSLTLSSATCNFGDSVTITPSNMVGCGISYVNVSVEGQKPKIDVINSVITISGLSAGTHTLKVVTTPDKNYKSVTKTTTITVRKVNSAIGFDTPMSFVYGTVGSISLNLDGCSIVKEGCTITDHNEAVIDVNKNVVKVSNLSAGSYTLRISSIPDSDHNAVTQDIVVTVTKADSNVDLKSKQLTFNYGETGQSNLILDGCSVLSDDVIVVGYANAITRVVDNVVYVSNLPANTYTLQIKTTPDGNHKSVTKTFAVTVNKPLSTVEFIGSADFDYLGVGKTTLKLTGCTVNLNDVEVVGYGDAGVSLDKSNVISISNLNSGSYTLKVKTTPDENHRANTATLAFKVNKIDSKISFTQDVISFKYAESGSTQIVLENCRVANMSVVGHDDVKPVLEDNVISVSGLPVGNYRLKVTTDPDDNYNSVDAYINVAVTKNAATITVKKSQTVAYKKSTNWAITLKDSKGNAISGVKVTLKIYKGNKLYKTVTNLKATDANGVTNYNTKGLPVGTYKFVVSFAHAGYTCNAVSTPVKVIKQTPVKIILNTKSDKKGAVISIIVKDKAGKKYLNNIKLTLSIKNGKTYNTVTLITGNYKSGKGVSAYSTNMLTVGSHNVKVETADIKYSGSASKNVKVLASAKKYRNWWEKISKGKKTSYGT